MNLADHSGNRPGKIGPEGFGLFGDTADPVNFNIGPNHGSPEECLVDGYNIGCGFLAGFLASGAAVRCPYGCSTNTNTILGDTGPSRLLYFSASPNGVGAYFPTQGPGTTFSTEAAALAAGALWAQAATQDNGVENCGLTYALGNGQYSFTGSVEGQGASCGNIEDAASLAPSGSKLDGGYHSHPDIPGYANERFSGQPGDAAGDIGWAQWIFGYPFSLGTPGGRVIIYYPAQDCQVFVTGSPVGTGTTIALCP